MSNPSRFLTVTSFQETPRIVLSASEPFILTQRAGQLFMMYETTPQAIDAF